MTTPRMPALFLGHGSPMNTIETNRNTAAWARIGRDYPRPKAILCISAHWYTRGTAVTAMAQPKTIHDFGGFPQALFDFQYPAPGDAALAARVRDLLAPVSVALDDSEWGLDHGTWSVLAHVYPKADVPVVQLSIDGTQPPRFHYELGKKLKPLRDEGVLIFGSGNVVHNLGVMQRGGIGGSGGYDWAERFNAYARNALTQRDDQALVEFNAQGADAQLSIPTPEHYLPLLYVLGAGEGDTVTIENDGLEMGSISMLSASFGAVTPAAVGAARA
jgi:4,5-DOPA dioxygenase extradiol